MTPTSEVVEVVRVRTADLVKSADERIGAGVKRTAVSMLANQIESVDAALLKMDDGSEAICLFPAGSLEKGFDPSTGGGVERDHVPEENHAGPNRTFPVVTPQDVADHAKAMNAMKDPQARGAAQQKLVDIATKLGPTFTAKLPDGMPKTQMSKEAPFQKALNQDELDAIDPKNFAGKNQSFYIRPGHPEDAHNAAQSIGRAGEGNFSTATLKANIIAISKRLGSAFVAQLPQNWQDAMAKAAADMKNCPTCDGKGSIMQGNRKCPDCQGSGKVPADFEKAMAQCDACGGTGKRTSGNCSACGGTGQLDTTSPIGAFA